MSERRASEAPSTSRAQLGLYVLLASLTALFTAACVAVLVTRAQIDAWSPPDATTLHWGIALSTALLLAASVCLERALRATRQNRLTTAASALRHAAVIALAFVAAQLLNCAALLSEVAAPSRSLYLFSVYLLIGLHAAHVAGGLVPIGVVLARLARQDYSSSRHEGLKLCVLYWHYLGAVWLGLSVALLWLSSSG